MLVGSSVCRLSEAIHENDPPEAESNALHAALATVEEETDLVQAQLVVSDAKVAGEFL